MRVEWFSQMKASISNTMNVCRGSQHRIIILHYRMLCRPLLK